VLQGGYPAKLKKVLIVTAPLWFKAPFKILRLFVREKLRDRVFTVSIPQVSIYCIKSKLTFRFISYFGTQPPLQWVLWNSFSQGWSGQGVRLNDRWLFSNTKVKNYGSCTSTPPYAFVPCIETALFVCLPLFWYFICALKLW